MNSSNSGNLCSSAFNGMLWPIRRMRFAAMLYYQGESNLDLFQSSAQAGPTNFACRLRAAVHDWRRVLEVAELPFVYIELAACNTEECSEQPSNCPLIAL